MFKRLKKILGYNFKTLIGFEAIYKFSSTVIFIPLFLSLFRLIMIASGYQYLTFENFISFLINPLTIIFLFILLLIITFYAIIDISTIIVILDSSYQEKKITIKESLIIALKRIISIFKLKNIYFIFLVLFLIPFLNIGISSGFMTTINIPEFIMDYITKNTTLSILYFILIIVLLVVLVKRLYVIHYFVLEGYDYKQAKKASLALNSKHKFKDFMWIMITEIVTGLFYIGFVLIGIIAISLFYKIFKTNILGCLSITFIWILMAISFIVILLLSTPLGYAIISCLYYKNKDDKKEKINHIKIEGKEKIRINKWLNNLKYVVIILIIFTSCLFTYSVMHGKYNLKIEYVKTMEVTAHRGASIDYPENTMSAFYGAKELGADYIELDVQQTKDEKLIVLHDTNLKRTTKVDKNTWEVTYDEIKEIDAGSFFSKEYKDERIPLLEKVIEFAVDNDIKLNIELKPTGHEVDFEKSVVELINKYNFKDNCVVTSQVYEVLEKIKQYDKDVKTVYVMSLAYGDITKLKSADNFSVEASSVNKKLVSSVHNAGKELYVWTVNTNDSIKKMVDLNVDNIITDNITLAKEIIYASKTSNIIEKYISLVNKLLG